MFGCYLNVRFPHVMDNTRRKSNQKQQQQNNKRKTFAEATNFRNQLIKWVHVNGNGMQISAFFCCVSSSALQTLSLYIR